VRSSRTYARIRSLTTGTFNLVVKDRIAVRRSGANSVQANPHKCESDCPRNPTNILCGAKPCQRPQPTEFPRLFHIGKLPRGDVWELPAAVELIARPDSRGLSLHLPLSSEARNGMALRLGYGNDSTHAEAEDRKLRKDPTFGGPCFEGTLQKLKRFRIEVPWPGRIESDTPSTILRCRTSDESCDKIAQLATLLLSVNCL
jgi:hypothetical protein